MSENTNKTLGYRLGYSGAKVVFWVSFVAGIISALVFVSWMTVA